MRPVVLSARLKRAENYRTTMEQIDGKKGEREEERSGQMGGGRKNECFPHRRINERTHSPSEAPAFLQKKKNK